MRQQSNRIAGVAEHAAHLRRAEPTRRVAGVRAILLTRATARASSAGFPPFSHQGSLVPNASLASYLRPGPGSATTDRTASPAIRTMRSSVTTPRMRAARTPARPAHVIEEKTTGFYTELNGDMDVGDKRLRYNLGVRYVRTDQNVVDAPIRDPRNTVGGVSLPDGASASERRDLPRREREVRELAAVGERRAQRGGKLHRASGAVALHTRANPNDLLAGPQLQLRLRRTPAVHRQPRIWIRSCRTTSTSVWSTTPAMKGATWECCGVP